MTQVVGIDVGAYKHAAAVCRAGERSAGKKVFRYEATRPGFNELAAYAGTHPKEQSSGEVSTARTLRPAGA